MVNVIYKVLCQKCPSFVYVGETQRKAKERFYQHKSAVNNNNLLQLTKQLIILCLFSRFSLVTERPLLKSDNIDFFHFG